MKCDLHSFIYFGASKAPAESLKMKTPSKRSFLSLQLILTKQQHNVVNTNLSSKHLTFMQKGVNVEIKKGAL